MMFKVLAYRRTMNIGDAVQTVALSRLLPGPLHGVFRDRMVVDARPDLTFVVNGYLRERLPPNPNVLWAGVYLAARRNQRDQMRAMSASRFPVAALAARRNQRDQMRAMSASRFPVAARDPHTARQLQAAGLNATLIGCATLTFPKYAGPRSGRYAVDVPGVAGAVPLKNGIDERLTWRDQWAQARQLLATLARAELVVTNRLHVALPCLAFGTPVVIPADAVGTVIEPERLSILPALGFVYGQPNVIDVTPWAERYAAFLEEHLNIKVEPHRPVFPVPLND